MIRSVAIDGIYAKTAADYTGTQATIAREELAQAALHFNQQLVVRS